MKVVVIGYGIPTKKYPVNGIFQYTQAKALSKNGIDVYYVSLDIRSIRRFRRYGISVYKKDGMKIIDISVPLGKMPIKLKNIVYSNLFKIAINIIEKRYGKPDLIHAHFIDIGYVASKNRINNKIPLVITEHSSSINAIEIEKKIKSMADYAYSNCDRVISVSPSLQEKILKDFGVKSIFIPNIVDDNIYNIKDMNKKNNKFKFISVARLEKVKNFDLLIDAFCDAFTVNEDVDLIIIGDGSQKNNLQKKIANLKRTNQISILGYKVDKEIARYLNESDCFVLSSNSETFAVVVAEAIMCGLPVISTSCGGPECMIHSNNGILVPVNDKKKMSDAMLYLYNNCDNYKKLEISQEAIKRFSSDSVAKEIINIYKDIIN